jgi:hypothetical protein
VFRDRRSPLSEVINIIFTMGFFTNLFSSNDGLHQVMRNGDLVTDLSTGRSGSVINESTGFTTVADDRGRTRTFIETGGITTDLSTGTSYFEI